MRDASQLSPRAARTRAALVAAGFELLARKPIDAIPIDEVVAMAGVGKGSFFNHFVDKPAFAAALATEVRLELEGQIARANAAVQDPLERIAGGMRVGAAFAVSNPQRAAVLLRSAAQVTGRNHPLNAGVTADFDAVGKAGLLRREAQETGVLYWLGLCQVLMASLIERLPDRADARRMVQDMTVLGLTGLGVEPARARAIAAQSAARILAGSETEGL